MDPQKQKLVEYIVQQLQAGVPAETLAAHLKAAKWPEEHIAEAFQLAQQRFIPQQYQAPQPPLQPATETVTTPAQAMETTADNAMPAESLATQTPGVTPTAAPTKKGRIKNGWLLFKQTMTILKGNKQLLRYLLMTTIWTLLVTIVFIAVYLVFDMKDVKADENATLSPLGYILGFLDYLLIYFIINYYAAGLTANILDIYRGQRKSYHDYMGVARSKIGPLFMFSLISAIVGFILQYVVERIRFVGWLISWILGTLWSLGTLFVIPLIVESDNPNGVVEIKQSVGLFKQTWGESITSKISVNFPLFIANVLLAVLYFIIVFPVTYAIGWIGFVIVTLLFFIAIFILSLIGSYANTAVNVALYYFAVHKQVPPAFDADLLNSVFIQRKRRRFFGKKAEA